LNIRLIKINGKNVEGEKDRERPEKNEMKPGEHRSQDPCSARIPSGLDRRHNPSDCSQQVKGHKNKHEPPIKIGTKMKARVSPKGT
jgi:hypothetical protein